MCSSVGKVLACEIFGQGSIPGGGTFPIPSSPFLVNLVIEGMEIKIKIGKLPLGSEIQQNSPEMEANMEQRSQGQVYHDWVNLWR